jgi:hypothetical protein
MPTTLEELIPTLRLKLGDINSASYRYLDEWLLSSLVAAVTALSRWWSNKYTSDDFGNVTRSTVYTSWETVAPPTIQVKDQWIIILMAAIIIKSGQLENLSWSLGNWRDSELSYSNLEQSRTKDAGLQRDWNELYDYLKPPIKRGAIPLRINWSDPS